MGREFGARTCLNTIEIRQKLAQRQLGLRGAFTEKPTKAKLNCGWSSYAVEQQSCFRP